MLTLVGSFGLFLAAAAASGQSVVGTVIDGMDGRPIANADVLVLSDSVLVARTQSGSDGVFRLELESAGTYVMAVRMIGYLSPDAVPLEVGGAEEVRVTLRLARSAIPLAPLTVEARRTDLRHAGTWEGFLARRERLPPIGHRRAIRWDDPEMEGALSVQDVLRWIVPPGRSSGCKVTLVDGVRRPQGLNEDPLETSVSLVEAVEYYARVTDAPLDYAAQSQGCGIIVIWMRRRP